MGTRGNSGLDDHTLILLLAAGDISAAAELYDRHAKMLFSIALRIVRDPLEAEDLVHDAFVTVGERASRYMPERGSVVAWFVIHMRNLSIDRRRRQTRRHALLRDVVEPETAVHDGDPESLTRDAAQRARVQKALAGLPERHRQVLEFAFFQGLTYLEIATREMVPVGTIKSRAARALSALRDALVEDVAQNDAATRVRLTSFDRGRSRKPRQVPTRPPQNLQGM